MAVKNLSRSIIELGRGKHGKFERKQRARGYRRWKLVDDEYVSGPRVGDSRELRDNLGPLQRWLKSQIGKPWSRVFSKFCRENDTRSLQGDHILSHLQQMVYGSGGREYCTYPSRYYPLCRLRGLHGWGGYFIGPTGLLEHHTEKDCWIYSESHGYFKPKPEEAAPYVKAPQAVVEPPKPKPDPVAVLKARKLERNRLKMLSEQVRLLRPAEDGENPVRYRD